MVVYRITIQKYAAGLFASGNPARWNSKDIKMIYTASSRALACLENVVHRTSKGLNDNFKTILVDIPNDLILAEIKISDLNTEWKSFANMPHTQKIGTQWIKDGSSAVLKVPSAIIPEEYNYLINPLHKDFSKVKYIGTEPFVFDERLKSI